VYAAEYLCTHHLTHPARLRPPARLLSALRPFPTTCGILLPVLVAAVGLQLVLVVVIVAIAHMVVSGIPDIGLGALEPPSLHTAMNFTAIKTYENCLCKWEECNRIWGPCISYAKFQI
jgi:integral membrane sensor domain MASE1